MLFTADPISKLNNTKNFDVNIRWEWLVNKKSSFQFIHKMPFHKFPFYLTWYLDYSNY